MNIDFSKAPEGATHYIKSGRDRVVWLFPGDYSMLHRVVDGTSITTGMVDGDPGVYQIPAFEPFTSVEDAPPTGSKHDPGHDPVNRPTHYASGGIECIVAIKASMSQEAFLGYLKGNVQKYLWRYEKKVNPVEDLKKARWYLDRLIAEQE